MKAEDVPNDAGNAIAVTWKKPVTEPAGIHYVIERSPSASGDSDWKKAGDATAGSEAYTDAPMEKGKPLLANGTAYRYRVVAEGTAGQPRAASAPAAPVAPAGSYFNWGRTPVLVFLLVFFGITIAFIELSKKGHPVYIRPIAGLKALEEAVGRATEMGKPVFFMPGIDEANNIQTLFGMVIAQLGVTPDVALATLRAHAFVHDRPIDAVARDVVARTLRFPEER